MRKDRGACSWTLLGAALWVAACSSGLPPEPSGSGGATGRQGTGSAGKAGSVEIGSPAAGSAGSRMMSKGRGEECPGGETDCRVGLHCVETMLADRTVKLCTPACVPNDESDCGSDDGD